MNPNDTSTQPAELPRHASAFRILLGCLLGSLALLALFHVPLFVIRTFFEMKGGPGALAEWLTGLTSVFSLIAIGAFTSPWGAIGALLGGVVAWKKFPGRSGPSSGRKGAQVTQSNAFMQGNQSGRFLPGELMLASGFVLALSSFGIFPSVMVWMLAAFTLPLALVFLAIGLVRIRKQAPATLQQASGLAFLLLAFIALAIAAVGGTFLSCQLVKALDIKPALAPSPGAWWWACFAGSWLVAPPLVSSGLGLWTDWPLRRLAVWRTVLWLFPAAALVVHLTLASIGVLPLSS